LKLALLLRTGAIALSSGLNTSLTNLSNRNASCAWLALMGIKIWSCSPPQGLCATSCALMDECALSSTSMPSLCSMMACGGGDDDDVDIVARFQRSLPCGASVRNLERVSKSGKD
jgi:hypothetical protein